MIPLNVKVISQDVTTLRQAFHQRKREYDTLRAAGEWSGAVLYAGVLLELALKIAISKNMDAANLPRVFQVHDFELLLYSSGLKNIFLNNAKLYKNFRLFVTDWSIEFRYEGTIFTAQDADAFHQALFDSTHGVLTSLASFL